MMMGLGLAAWIGSWFLAHAASDSRRGRHVAVLAVVVVVLGYGALFGLTSLPTSTPVAALRVSQLALLGLYFLFYGLVPAALGRLFRSPRLAVAIAVLLPFAGLGIGHGRGVSEGMGHLGDLLFLSPEEMGTGVARDGGIPHRFRIHWIALGALVLVGLAAQFLPAARADDPK